MSPTNTYTPSSPRPHPTVSVNPFLSLYSRPSSFRVDTRSQRFEKSIFRKTRRFNFRKENFDQAQKSISTISVVQEILYYLFCKSKKMKRFFLSTVGRSTFFFKQLEGIFFLAKISMDCEDAAFLSAGCCQTTGAPMHHTVRPIVVAAETLAEMFAAQTSVLDAVSFFRVC